MPVVGIRIEISMLQDHEKKCPFDSETHLFDIEWFEGILSAMHD